MKSPNEASPAAAVPENLWQHGHGHVTPRKDGAKARCGGPAFCSVCQKELAALSSSTAAPAGEPKAELTTCNCRWKGDVLVQRCTLHEAWRDSIHEWAERAKTAEHKLAIVTAALSPQPEQTTEWDRVLRSSVPDRWKGCASPVSAVQSYIAELERALLATDADALKKLEAPQPEQSATPQAAADFLRKLVSSWRAVETQGIYATLTIDRDVVCHALERAAAALASTQHQQDGGKA